MSALAAYFELTKPRLLPLVLFSGLPALVIASQGWPPPLQIAAILGGIALAAGSANALNSYLERDRDRHMARTATRPLPAGRLRAGQALGFGLLLGVLGPALLWVVSGAFAAAVALAGILFYVFVYTIWLKPRTPIAVVVGGVAGAVAPLIADAAIEGRIGAAGWMLFAIVFAWQPPHFWAIALYRREEYERAGFPLLVSRIGEQAVRRRIAWWIAALVPVSLLPVAQGMLSPVYGAVALVLGALFFWYGVRLLRERDSAAARSLFRVSLLYLAVLFTVMIADLVSIAVIG
jgi:protoheme IX farnesyltransferase